VVGVGDGEGVVGVGDGAGVVSVGEGAGHDGLGDGVCGAGEDGGGAGDGDKGMGSPAGTPGSRGGYVTGSPGWGRVISETAGDWRWALERTSLTGAATGFARAVAGGAGQRLSAGPLPEWKTNLPRNTSPT
jgi:hypothetical protein